MVLSVVHTHLLLALWLSLWYTTIFYWPTGPPYVRLLSSPGPVAQSYGTLTFSTGPLAVSVVHYYLLLAHWLSLWYTLIFLWPTGPSYCTQLSSSSPLPPHVSVVHYYLLLTHWLSLWYITIFFLPTGYPFVTISSPIGPLLSLWYTTIFFWPTANPYGTRHSPTGPLDISMVHYYLLLAHWIALWFTPLLLAHLLSLWYTTLSYWPTGYLSGTLLSSTGLMVISMVHYPLLLAHWISLLYTSIFYWPAGYLFGTIPSPIGNHYGTPLSLPAHWKSQWYIPLQSTHWLSLMFTLIFYWPTGYLNGTLPTPSDPMAISVVYYPPLLAHWLSLWYTTIFYWPT